MTSHLDVPIDDASALDAALRHDVHDLNRCLDLAKAWMRAHRTDLASRFLQIATIYHSESAELWFQLALSAREEQDPNLALTAIDRAFECSPNNAMYAVAFAQMRLDCGFPCVDDFRVALKLSGNDRSVARSLALALESQGDLDGAKALLTSNLTNDPTWIEGHRALLTLRWTQGDRVGFDRSFEEAVESSPRNSLLWKAWFEALAQAKQWDKAERILVAAEEALGQASFLTVLRSFLAVESGRPTSAPNFDDASSDVLVDPIVSMTRIRLGIRTNALQAAEREALRLASTKYATMAWPYLSTLWRLGGNARWQWLDGATPRVRAYDLGFSASKLSALAAVLRELHAPREPHLDQSVRGGTQTDGQLFFRTEPELAMLRRRILDAVTAYVAELPAHCPGHPLLGTPRTRIRFSGSWSVRLGPGGRNVPHTHPRGWISGAFYVAMPSDAQLGRETGGSIEFGIPPAELGVCIDALERVKPRPGLLVLFPSTLWHSTVPFNDGERLVVAFDIRTPEY